MRKIIFFMVLICMGLTVNACTLNWQQGQGTFSLSQWDIISNNSGAAYCNRFTNATHDYLQCCSDTAAHGTTNYIMLRGMNGATVSASDGFDINLTIKFDAAGTYVTPIAGIINSSVVPIGLTKFLVYTYSSSANQLRTYCGDGTNLETAASTAGIQTNIMRYTHTIGDNFINVYRNGTSLGTCPYSNTDRSPIKPVLDILYTSGGAATAICARLYDINVISNVTLSGSFNVKTDTGSPVSNCTVTHTENFIGTPPYWSNLSITTNILGFTPDIKYYPVCYFWDYPGEGWEIVNTVSASCPGNYSTSIDKIQDFGSYNDNHLTNITVFLNGVSTTTTTIPNTCSFSVQAQYTNGTAFNNATVDAGYSHADYFGYTNNTGFAQLNNLPCQTFNLYVVRGAEGKIINNVYPSGQTIQIYIDVPGGANTITINTNITNYGALPVIHDIINVYDCPQNYYCNFANLAFCSKLTEGNPDSTGYKQFTPLSFTSNHICIQNKYEYGGVILDDIYSNAEIIPGISIYNFTFSLNQYNQNQYCIGFVDSITQNKINSVTVELKQDNVIKISGTTSADTNAYLCFNVTDNNKIFNIYASKTNYNSINGDYITFSDSNIKYMNMYPIQSNITTKYYVQGYTLYNSNIKAYIPVQLTCDYSSVLKNSNSAGFFNFTNMNPSYSCTLKESTPEYDGNIISFALTENKNYNITLTNKTSGGGTNIRSFSFTIIDKDTMPGVNIPLDNVHITLSYSSLPTLSCYTENGVCTIDNIQDNINYNVVLSKNNFESKSFTLPLNGDDGVYFLVPTGTTKCFIEGHTYYQNVTNSPQIPIIASVYLLDNRKNIIDGGKSDIQGKYKYYVSCGISYYIQAIYNENTLTEGFATKETDGSFITHDFNFKGINVIGSDNKEDIISFFWSLTGIYKMIILFTVFAILALSVDSISGNKPNSRRY